MNSEQSIVINDLLSFISCKIKCTPRDKLLHSLRNYYSEKVILHAQKTLLESLPVKKSTRHGRNVKHPDPLVAMYDCFQLIPSEDLPVFVCRNLNNVPHLEALKEVIKCELLDTDDCDNDEEILNPHQDIKDEQIVMKSQIADITDVVKQIKDQLKHIVEQQPSPSSPAKQSKAISFSKTGTKRKKIFISNNNKISSKTIMSIPNEPKKSPKKTMAYIQKLIDEDEEMKNETQDEERDEEDSDYYDEIISDEERVVVQNACEVVLKEGLEDVFDHSILTTRGSPLKIPGEKIIYIKNEEEDFSFDSFDMDEENSIEISSADHYVNFDMDSSSRGGIENVKNEDNFEGEIEHTLNEDDSLALVCPECGIPFENKYLFNEHIKKHTVKKLFECVLCGLKFRSKEQHRYHYATCIDATKEKYKLTNCCTRCGMLFAEGRALKQHSYVHSLSRRYACDKCTFRFLTPSALKAHYTTQHGTKSRYSCPYCDSNYFSITNLKIHVRSHTGERPYECQECPYKAATPDLLKRHMLKHRPPERYTCDICNLEFLGNNKLSRHKAKEHKKEKIHCIHCNKVFNNSCVYHRHYVSHVGQRNYHCSMCRYSAISKEVLMGHLKVHTGKELIHCPQCAVPFGTKLSLKRHLKEYCEPNIDYINVNEVIC